MLFLSEYEHSIDEKQRLAIPAEVRDVLGSAGQGTALVAAPGSNGALWLWPEVTFAQLAEELQSSLLGHEDLEEFVRWLFSQAARLVLDSAGRIRIPDRLLTQHSLSGSVTLIGVRDHLELLTPAAWANERDRLEPSRNEIWRRAREAIAQRRKDSTS